MLSSAYECSQEGDAVQCWDKARKIELNIPIPKCANEYNQNIEKINKLDTFIALYCIIVR